MPLSSLPIRATAGYEANPTATDLNTVIAQVNTNTDDIANVTDGTTPFTGAVVSAVGVQSTAVARTATAAPGGTTGVIADGSSFVTVTSDDANKVITLPTPTPGTIVSLRNGATGYELRSSAPATVAINGGAEANAESAIGANVLTVCRCDTATTWICTNYATDGTVSATEVAAAA